jgi:hypothetical protein
MPFVVFEAPEWVDLDYNRVYRRGCQRAFNTDYIVSTYELFDVFLQEDDDDERVPVDVVALVITNNLGSHSSPYCEHVFGTLNQVTEKLNAVRQGQEEA